MADLGPTFERVSEEMVFHAQDVAHEQCPLVQSLFICLFFFVGSLHLVFAIFLFLAGFLISE